MIVFEAVVLNLGFQFKICGHSPYGKWDSYLSIHLGFKEKFGFEKKFPRFTKFLSKILSWLFFSFEILRRDTSRGIDDGETYRAVNIVIGPWHYHKDFLKYYHTLSRREIIRRGDEFDTFVVTDKELREKVYGKNAKRWLRGGKEAKGEEWNPDAPFYMLPCRRRISKKEWENLPNR
jgi:hypothetical protein